MIRTKAETTVSVNYGTAAPRMQPVWGDGRTTYHEPYGPLYACNSYIRACRTVMCGLVANSRPHRPRSTVDA